MWESLIPVAASMVGGLLGGQSGSQTQTTSKAPWSAAAPWMQKNIDRGQQLQDFYTANPFSEGQKTAYGNQSALSDNYRAMMPQLLASMSNQGGFDRNNPTARPQSFNFTQPQGQNLGFGSMSNSQQFAPQQMALAAPAKPAVAPTVSPESWDQLFARFGVSQGS